MTKYWEEEEPDVIEAGRNRIKIYPEAGKIQVFTMLEGAPHGVGKGATINLLEMNMDELADLKDKLVAVIEAVRWDKVAHNKGGA